MFFPPNNLLTRRIRYLFNIITFAKVNNFPQTYTKNTDYFIQMPVFPDKSPDFLSPPNDGYKKIRRKVIRPSAFSASSSVPLLARIICREMERPMP